MKCAVRSGDTCTGRPFLTIRFWIGCSGGHRRSKCPGNGIGALQGPQMGQGPKIEAISDLLWSKIACTVVPHIVLHLLYSNRTFWEHFRHSKVGWKHILIEGNLSLFGGKVLLGVIINNWGQDNHFWGAKFYSGWLATKRKVGQIYSPFIILIIISITIIIAMIFKKHQGWYLGHGWATS